MNGITNEIKVKQLRMPNKEIYDDNNGLVKHKKGRFAMKQKSWIFKASGSLFLVFLLGLSLLMSFAMAEENALEAVQLPEITEDALPVQQSQNGSAIFGIAVMGKEKDVEISWEGNYTFVQVTGTYKSPKPSLVYAAPGSRDGLQVIEAWKVQNIKKNTALSMTIRLNALPTLAEGESLAFYMLDNGEMANGPLLTDVSAGDLANVQLEFKGTDGVALVRVAADPGDLPVDDQFIWANGDIYLTGKMPGNAVVDATPVTVEVDGEIVLAAYDVRIYTNEKKREKGKTWQPSDKKVQVHFFSDAFRDGQEMNVYHLTDGNSLPEKVATVTAEDSWIAFEAESFSTYAVTVREKIVEASNGETYKITVTYDAASGIPADARVEAAEISDSSEIYKEYLLRTAQALDVDVSSVVYSRLFDISLVGPDGQKYQPSDDVSVSIQLLQDAAEDVAQVRVVHFAEERQALQPMKLNAVRQTRSASSELAATAEGTTVSFKTSGFSMFTLIDTHVAGDGQVNAVQADTGDSITLGGPVPTHGILEAIPVEAEIDGAASLLAYDMTVYANRTMQNIGIAWQPSGSPVQVTLSSDDLTAERVDVYHISGEDDRPELVAENMAVRDGSVTFDAVSFSVYAIVETTLTQTVEASDRNTYEIEVTYKNTAGIPMEGTALLVSELKPGDARYDEYIAASAQNVGAAAENIELSKIFDIQIVDENDHGTVYEPAGDVEVSIRLVGETLNDYANIDVLHFVEDENTDGFTVYDLDSTVNGESVQFTTDSFSVYAVIGSVHVRTFYFYTFDEYLDYVPYYLNTDIGTEDSQTYMQIVREGEIPVAPQNPINPQDQEAAFSGWYQGSANTADGPTATVPYTFSAVPDLSEDDSVYLYAKFSRYIYVIFHDQYDAGSNSFPVAFTRRIDLNSEGDWYVDVTQYSVSYEDPNEVDNTAMVFVGWSEAPITTPGAALNDDGDTVTQVNTNNGQLWATQTTHLYPIFAPVKWISFYSGPSGSHATYFTDTYYLNGIGPENLPGRVGQPAMTRDGNYEFAGWYINASLDSNGEVDITGATMVAGADGVLNTSSEEDMAKLTAGGITFENTAASGETPSWRIKLTGNVTLYAHWTQRTTANYTVVIVKQNATDGGNLGASNTYYYSESFILSGTINAVLDAMDNSLFGSYRTLDTLAGYNALHDPDLTADAENPYVGYSLSSNSDTSVTVSEDGSGILYFRYDWNDWTNPPSVSSSDKFTLRFVDPMADPDYVIDEHTLVEVEGSESVDLRIPYGTSLSTYVPATPTSTVSADGLTFNGWYADRACTTRAFFDQDSYDTYMSITGHGAAVLFATMPAADMTFYAGWTREWFLIKIDPNYGELYKHVYTDTEQTTYATDGGEPVFTGTGSTWFWKEYGDTFQEYTTVRRDYVESDSGSWYFVKHDRDYYGYPDPDDPDYDENARESGERKTYYTKDLGEATEFTTFEYQEGVYRYAGWYEVFDDGTEADTRYDFSQIVDHNITLRMRWQKVGAFYLQYDAGLGTLNHDEENEVLYLELDGDSYADDADVLITRAAAAPSGYEFVGWRIRSDESGTIYRAGQTFHLLSRFMATVQGKRTVFLDAVYEQVPTTTIVYHANGATVGSGVTEATIDYGHYSNQNTFYSATIDSTLVKSEDLTATDPTATVSHIVNNSIFELSNAAWLEMTDAIFAGWCENKVFDPDDADHPLLKTDGSEQYRVGANAGETAEQQTVHLYAIWQVDVKYHLNETTANANFGGDWDASVYSLSEDIYTQSVYVGSKLSWPPYDPVTSIAGRSFRGWATSNSASSPLYDFSQPVTGALDLYALWDTAPTCDVLVVDSSDYPTIAFAPWVDSDNDGTPDGRAEITVTSEHQTPAELATAITSAADAYNSTNSKTYAFSFATVLGNTVDMQYIQEERIDQIYYSPQDGKTHLVYDLSTANERDAALDDDEQLYFVYYQVRTPDIGYLLMEISGNVTDITSQMISSAPTSTAGLTGVTISADTAFTIYGSGSYHPMTWLPSTITGTEQGSVPSSSITHYNFAIGDPGATNSVDLAHKTEAYTASDTRPDLYIKNTWQGIRFSQDGTNWFSAGTDPKLYVVFYTETPTVVTLYNNTVGLAADMDTQFTYDYWIENIPLDNNGNPDYTSASLVFTSRPSFSQQLAAGDTYSAFTTTNSSHTYRVTFVLTPEDGFAVTRPTTLLDPATLQPVSGSSPEIAVPVLENGNVTGSNLPSWVSGAGDTRDATYHYSKADVPYTFSYTVRADDGYCGKSALIPFTNTRSVVNVDLHVAKADLNGNIYHAPEWRQASIDLSNTVWNANNAYTVPIQLGETKSLFDGYTYDKFTQDVDANYKPGALIYGQDRHTSHSHSGASGDNDLITLDENASLGCYRLSYELVDPSNPNVYELYMRDGSSDYRYPLTRMSEQIAHGINGVTHPDDGTVFYRLYYLFYPAVTVYYVVENADGSLSPVKGSTNGTDEIDTITYNGAQAKLNSHYDGMQADLNTEIVQQGQKVGIWTQSLEISQKVGDDANGNPIFNIPPLLDNGTHPLDLIYYKLGASTQAAPGTAHDNITDFPGTKDNGYIDPDTNSVYTSGVTEELVLHIGIKDHRLQWQFVDEPAPQILDSWPVVYAIYRERGYNLTVTKTVTVDTGYTEPYTVTITSSSINRDKYTVSGTGYSTIEATPASGSTPGSITFNVKDGDSVTIHGLIPGAYTVVETGNENDILSAATDPILDPAVTVTDNSTVSFTLGANTELQLTNDPKWICRYGSEKFRTLSSAVEYISAHSSTMSGTIEMLTDYLMPASDTPVIPSYLNISLTTANDYSGSGGTATITRKSNVTTPMISNLGTFTLGNVILDGNSVSGSAMISNEGTLTLGGNISVTNLTTTTTQGEGGEVTTTTATAATQTNTSPVLQNAAGSGNGGAINSLKGTVNIVGGTIENCSAVSGGAIYAEAGAVNISGGMMQDNSATSGGALYYAGSDTVTISGGTIGAENHANIATNGGALYMASGTADITGGTISYNIASQSGGAIYALNAYVNVNGNSASIDHNTATVNGGAVHMETLTFKLIKGSITDNSAPNGGAIWAGTGTVELSGGSMSKNSATSGSGGAVYTQSSAFSMTGGTLSDNTANENGGGVYTESGSVTVSGSNTQIKNNAATTGSGGGVYADSGSVTMSSSAKLYGNTATGGNGGALYVGSGTASLNGVTVGDTTAGNANQAVNGSGVFVNTGTLSITDGSIGGNAASAGGAVGFGSAEARLNLYNKVKIIDNTMAHSGGEPMDSNVYLNFDTDAIINFQTLSNDSNTYVGIYVSDDAVTVDGKPSTVLEQRGVPNTRFGVYVNDSAKDNMGKIHNDRTPNLTVRNDTTNKKLYWVRGFKVKVYYVADYTSGLPFGNTDYTNSFATSGRNFKKQLDETPPKADSAISDVAADIRTKGVSLTTTAVFGNAFVQPTPADFLTYGEYLTDINWNTTDNLWDYVKRDGTNVPGGTDPNATKTLIFIFTEPYYLSIENNAKDESGHGLTLDISSLAVTVNGTAQSVINNYGYLYARNDEIQDQLKPVKASDLVLAYGESIRILLPGGKNMAYSLTGTYYDTYDPNDLTTGIASDTVGYRQRVTTDSSPTQLATGSVDASAAFTVNNTEAKTPSTAGQTHQLIFGGDRAICRLVVGARIEENGEAVSTGFVDEHAGEGATVGKYEYTFSSPKQANDFITAHHSAFTSGTTVTATIEMLMDYMIPASEQVSLSTGNSLQRDITFQTAVDGYFRYDPDNTNAAGTGTKPRATISRASGNLSSFIAAPNGTLTSGDYVDTLKVQNLIFDGKSFGGKNIDHGIIDTNGWNVEIDHCDFNNCQAKYGGGMFVKSVTPSTGVPYGHLTVTNSRFNNCQSLENTDKYGGGAIWTSMKTLTVEDCTFTSCTCTFQGGALFHFVDTKNDRDSYTTINKCIFESCSAGQAAGSMESGAKWVTVSNTTFRNSTSNNKNGGALNIWSGNSDSKSGQPTTDCWVNLTGCTFENCYALNGTGDRGNGGAMRSTAKYNTITDCRFINNIGNNGGAINIYNKNAVDTVLSGCTFDGCSARDQGGAIWCRSKTLTIDAINHETNAATPNTTSIRNCTAPNEGGGVYHDNSSTGSTLTVKDTTIDTCSSTTKAGGGVYTTALTASFTDSTVKNCSTSSDQENPQNGGGLYLAGSWTTLDGTNIQNCTATGLGGGVYQNNGTKESFTVKNGSVISENKALGTVAVTSNSVTYQQSGGGIYTNTKLFTLQDSSVMDNQAAGSGGGICQNYDNTNGSMTVNGATVTGNISGGMGGGIYTLTNMALKGVTRITGNRLTTDSTTANNAAGVYLRNGVTLSLGTTGETAAQHVFDITGNLTVDGTLSDLRLPDTTSGEIVNANSVKVYCDIDGEIRVVNAKKKLTQFGTAQKAGDVQLTNPAGFTDEHKVFWADDGSLYGIVDRQDTNGKKIIWGGDPICKITDGNGRLLYIKVDDTHYRPAVFDRLDSGNTSDTSSTSAFSTLRGPGLYYVNGEAYTGSDYQVKMLVEDYTAEYFITATGGTGRNVTLTTAKTTDSLYPYRGREGTRCTILRDPRMDTGKALVTAQTNLALTNIVLDGGSENGVTANNNTRIITADAGQGQAIQITLGRNATLQNAEVTGTLANNNANGKGGGVYLNNGAKLAITGGAIRNCSAVNGGAVYIDAAAGAFTMSVGTITRCTASGDGGGVYFNKGVVDNASDPTSGFMRITGGSITRCTAESGSGGGVYLNGGNGSRTLYMSGGSIASNYAAQKGGGIFVGDGNVRIYFSGAPYVHGSTSGVSVADDDACNVEMDQTFDRSSLNPGTVIVSSGLNRGAKIGVYVPGDDSGKEPGVSGAADTDTLYDKHGAEMDPFATFTEGNERGLNYFLNDRNGMKGGRLDNPNGSDYKIYWRIIYALSVKKQVLSDDPADMTTYRFRLTLSGTIPGQNSVPDTRADSINGIYGDLTFTPNTSNNTSVATFTLTNGQTKTADLLPLGFHYKVEELLTTEQISHFHTSVENWDGAVNSGLEASGDMATQTHFNYLVTFSNLHAICKLTDQLGRLLYTYNSDSATYIPAVYSSLVTAFNKVNAGNDNHWFCLGDDGNYNESYPDSYQIQMLVAECELEDMASLMNGRTALLTTADRDADDGFPYVGSDTTAKITRAFDGESMISVSDGSLTLGNITLDGDGSHHTTNGNGGIVNVASGSSLTVGTGATLQNSTTSGDGAGVYLAQDSTMNISGAPVFSKNLKTNASLGNEPKNGGAASYYSGSSAEQDIYIAGYSGTDATSLRVTGDLIGSPGSIAVWAAQEPHYKLSRQFAVMQIGRYSGLNVFRNARTDTDTDNPLRGSPLYLYGVSRGDDGKVYWSGGANLTITKTVTGDLGDTTKAFWFTVPNLPSGESYTYKKYATADGEHWLEVDGGDGTLSSNSTFSLAHRQKIVIEALPLATALTVTETNENYTTSWTLDNGIATTGVSLTATLTGDATLGVENNLPAVSPTGVVLRMAPYAVMLSAGIVLAVIIIVGKNRRKNKKDE